MSIRFFFIFLLFISCNNNSTEEFVISKTWLHDSGYKITKGDVLKFTSEFAAIRGDTIFIRNEAKAKIDHVSKELNELYIRSCSSDTIGIYINAEEFER